MRKLLIISHYKTLKQKQRILLLFFLVFAIGAKAQFGGCYTAVQLKDRLLPTTTLILNTGNDEFDENFEAGMKKYWTHTRFRFVDRKEFDLHLFESEYSFIKPYNESHATEYGGTKFSMLGLFFAEAYETKGEQLIASALIDELNIETKTSDADYRAEHLAKFMNDFIALRFSGVLAPSCSQVKSRYIDYFNKANPRVANKTLYINKQYLSSHLKESTIEKMYAGKFKIVSDEDITNGIADEREDACYLLSISSFRKYTFIVDFATGDILYAIEHSRGVGLNKRDFQYLNLKLGLTKK
jgi:hypothetical protein